MARELAGMGRPKRVVVIGAGIVGLAAARWLQRDGHQVTLLDPAPPGTGASFGNAGCLSPSSIVPLSGPGLLRQVPGWLRDPSGPLKLRWRHLPRAAPWLLRFVRAGHPDRADRLAAALHTLLAPVHDTVETLLPGAGASGLVRRDGSLIVYRTAEGWRGGQRSWSVRRDNGIAWQELEPEALRALDPALAPGLYRGVLLPGNGHVLDPHGLVARLAADFADAGGVLLRTQATGFTFEETRLRAVGTPDGPVPADAAVLAAGAQSRRLAGLLGDRVPLESERGYHLMLDAVDAMPRYPTLHAEDRFVATPLAAGLRLTGTVELAGLAAPPDWRRAHALLPLARRLYPGLATARGGAVWMGHRPSTPDSLPVIGRSRRSPDVVHGFGHGHLGLTGGPFTGRLVAELVAGRPSAIDLAPFSPGRFRWPAARGAAPGG